MEDVRYKFLFITFINDSKCKNTFIFILFLYDDIYGLWVRMNACNDVD